MISIEINKETFQHLATFLFLSLEGEGFPLSKPDFISIIKTKGWDVIIKVNKLQPTKLLSFVEALARYSRCMEQTHDAQPRRSRGFQC